MAQENVIVRQNTYTPYADGQERVSRGNRRAEQIILSALQQAVFDKKVFQASIGSATTPVSMAKTAYDADQPQLICDVPVGKTILPLEGIVSLEDSAGTDTEVIWGAAGANAGAGTSTAVTPVNMWIAPTGGAAPASSCTVYRQYTGNSTDITAEADFQEFYREVYAFADATTDPFKTIKWSALNNIVPLIGGAGACGLWIVGTTTAPAGFVRLKWWEFGSDEV